MRIYSVYLPQAEDDDERLEAAIFVREGFSWPALFFSVLWFAFHKMWMVTAVLAALLILSGWGFSQLDVIPEITFLVHTGLVLLFAFEANSLRGQHLQYKGFENCSSISGHALVDAEEKFFKSWYAVREHTQQIQELTPCA